MKKANVQHEWKVWAAWLALGALLSLTPAVRAAGHPLRVALLADTHITRDTKETQRLHQGRFDRTMATVNAAEVDLVLIAGDLTENGTESELGDFRAQIRKLKAPVWYVPGNHDVGGKRIPGKSNQNDITRQRLEHYERSMGPSWFVRERAGLRVVGVNGPLLGSGFPEELRMWTDLTNALATPATGTTFLLIHYPLYTERPNEPGGVYWNVEPSHRQRLLELLSSGGVGAVLSGHLHKELLMRQEGRWFVTTPPVAFGLPPDRRRGWTLLTVPAQGDIQTEIRHEAD